MKLRTDQTRAEERDMMSGRIGRMTRALDGETAPGDLPFQPKLSPGRRDALLTQARAYNARGLPLSAALLLMASGDPDAREVASSREYAEARELIEARHDVAALATHHSTWQFEHPKNQWQRLSTAGLNGAQLSFIREAPVDGARYDLSELGEKLRRYKFHGDSASRHQIRAAYIGLLLLTQAPETRLICPSRINGTLHLLILNKVARLLLNNHTPGLSFGGGYKGARPGVFNLRFELPERYLKRENERTLTGAERKRLVARGAHRASSVYIHLNAAHIEELSSLAAAPVGEQGALL